MVGPLFSARSPERYSDRGFCAGDHSVSMSAASTVRSVTDLARPIWAPTCLQLPEMDARRCNRLTCVTVVIGRRCERRLSITVERRGVAAIRSPLGLKGDKR